MIKTALFDIAGVLLTDGMKKWVTVFADKFNLNPDDLKDIFAGDLSDRYHAGLLSSDQFWGQAFAKLHIDPVDTSDLEWEWAECYDMIEQTKDIIFELKKTIPVYYLSNQTALRANALEKKYQLSNIYSGGVYSYDRGLVKPDIKMYQLAINVLRIRPEETVFVDDFESNLKPARECGMHTILNTTSQHLRTELNKLNLLTK